MSGETHIDWQKVHGRLQASNQALKEALEPSAASIMAVQKRRAAYLAARNRVKDGGKTLSVLIFHVCAERFAVELAALSEITGATTCTPLPGLMDRLLGLANLRGEIRPVLDTAALLGVPRAGAANRTAGAVMFLRNGAREIGLSADHVEGIAHMMPDMFRPPPDEAAMPRRFIKGLTNEALALIDVAGLLAGTGHEEETTKEG
jgi:chemotaxis signal transduction protein